MRRTVVETATGNYVAVCTDYVPFPLGRNKFETAVYKCRRNGLINKAFIELDLLIGASETEARANHSTMVRKWKGDVGV